MRCLLMLWRNEVGAVLSTEMVLVGTLGVVGATVGLKALSTSVNEELLDLARAIRSLDQSYEIPGVSRCGAWTAGSAYRQEPVEVSLRRLEESMAADAEEERTPQARPPHEPESTEERPGPTLQVPESSPSPLPLPPLPKQRKTAPPEEVVL
jgi:hypothetical protein